MGHTDSNQHWICSIKVAALLSATGRDIPNHYSTWDLRIEVETSNFVLFWRLEMDVDFVLSIEKLHLVRVSFIGG